MQPPRALETGSELPFLAAAACVGYGAGAIDAATSIVATADTRVSSSDDLLVPSLIACARYYDAPIRRSNNLSIRWS